MIGGARRGRAGPPGRRLRAKGRRLGAPSGRALPYWRSTPPHHRRLFRFPTGFPDTLHRNSFFRCGMSDPPGGNPFSRFGMSGTLKRNSFDRSRTPGTPGGNSFDRSGMSDAPKGNSFDRPDAPARLAEIRLAVPGCPTRLKEIPPTVPGCPAWLAEILLTVPDTPAGKNLRVSTGNRSFPAGFVHMFLGEGSRLARIIHEQHSATTLRSGFSLFMNKAG